MRIVGMPLLRYRKNSQKWFHRWRHQAVTTPASRLPGFDAFAFADFHKEFCKKRYTAKASKTSSLV
jgi:hypothetical protein